MLIARLCPHVFHAWPLCAWPLYKGVTLHCTSYNYLRPRSKSQSRVKQKIRTSQRSNSDYKGPVGQESSSYKGTTIDTYAVYGILRYNLREIDQLYYGQRLREKRCSQRSSIIFGGSQESRKKIPPVKT